ncbi:CocE/NonD family hydrolase [Lentilactobacillus otakiensis]|uniref:alpha/beta hydrolase n=1 Tax=Lentilactobacillus otakiensis TaxID=481720 RepID=UPI003D174F3E
MNKTKYVSRLTGLLAVSLGMLAFQMTTYADTTEPSDSQVTSAQVSQQSDSAVEAQSESSDAAASTVDEPADNSTTARSSNVNAESSSVETPDSSATASDNTDQSSQPVDSTQPQSDTEDTVTPSDESQQTATSEEVATNDSNQQQPTDQTISEDSSTTADQQRSETTTTDSTDTTNAAQPSANDQITIPDANNADNQAWKQSSNNPFINFLTGITSTIAAGVVYPFAASRQGAALLSKIRTLMSPDRYDVDQMWSDLDEKYDPEYTKTYYTEAQNWYDNEVVKETMSVPFADGTGNASATYIAHPGSTKTIIYGQGWTTEPEWMGYISKVFYDMGYNVLMPYTRGQNSSDGEFLTFGDKDKADWINWINKIDERNGANSEVVLYGQSLGADSALETAAQTNLPKSVKAVIADCGFSTIPSLLFSLYSGVANSLNNITSKIGWNLNGTIPLVPFDQFLNGFNNINKLFQGFSLDDVSGITAVQNSKLPTMFIATADDAFIPDTETETMYNLSASTLKQLWILDGNVGGHASANNAVKDYMSRIQAFLNQVDGQNSDNKLNITDDQQIAA